LGQQTPDPKEPTFQQVLNGVESGFARVLELPQLLLRILQTAFLRFRVSARVLEAATHQQGLQQFTLQCPALLLLAHKSAVNLQSLMRGTAELLSASGIEPNTVCWARVSLLKLGRSLRMHSLGAHSWPIHATLHTGYLPHRTKRMYHILESRVRSECTWTHHLRAPPIAKLVSHNRYTSKLPNKWLQRYVPVRTAVSFSLHEKCHLSPDLDIWVAQKHSQSSFKHCLAIP
jgi:hypothetical protein